MNFYLSTANSKKNILSEVLDEFIAFGIKNIELSGNLRFYRNMQRDLRNYKRRYGLQLLIHNYFPPVEDAFVLNLATKNPITTQKNMKLINKAAYYKRYKWKKYN